MDPGHAHHDVLALEIDLRARDAEPVHAIREDRHHFLHVRGGGDRRGLVDDRETARQVQTEFGPPSERHGCCQRSKGNGDGENETDDHRSS